MNVEPSAAATAAHPGYVRLVLPSELARARAACRKFSRLCDEEGARGGLILAAACEADHRELEGQIALATSAVSRGFKLAVVAQGHNAALIFRIAGATAARRKAKARVFSSEHRAAAWLMA